MPILLAVLLVSLVGLTLAIDKVGLGDFMPVVYKDRRTKKISGPVFMGIEMSSEKHMKSSHKNVKKHKKSSTVKTLPKAFPSNTDVPRFQQIRLSNPFCEGCEPPPTHTPGVFNTDVPYVPVNLAVAPAE